MCALSGYHALCIVYPLDVLFDIHTWSASGAPVVSPPVIRKRIMLPIVRTPTRANNGNGTLHAACVSYLWPADVSSLQLKVNDQTEVVTGVTVSRRS